MVLDSGEVGGNVVCIVVCTVAFADQLADFRPHTPKCLSRDFRGFVVVDQSRLRLFGIIRGFIRSLLLPQIGIAQPLGISDDGQV